ncbi:MAG: TnsA-like heteromeric transposase endonuclease subunit [Actinomycetia bacterium]|nr:TnsA-like heteromeric transposase endonuclease subunit [Actinomycetes bacterium]
MCRPWLTVSTDTLGAASPWRTFRWYRGQKHYSGTYWSATCGGHLIYESRMELARLLLADFDRAVSWIVPQPFLLEVVIHGRLRRHIPDFLLITGEGPVVVDVKPASQVLKPVVAQTFAWTRQVVESRGWSYEVFTGVEPTLSGNIRFLAGYRRTDYFRDDVLEMMSSPELVGLTVAEAISRRKTYSPEISKSALMHMLWRQHFVVDMTTPLSGRHVLEAPG